MSKSTQQAEAVAKIRALQEWFKDRDLPRGTFHLNAWETVTNCQLYVNCLLARTESLDVYSLVLRAAYRHLVELKKYLELTANDKPIQ